MQAPSLKGLVAAKADFLEQSDPVLIAKELLDYHLIHWIDGKPIGGRIVETEAYKAPEDPACHAHMNRRTKRTKTMFAKGGHAYVYLCYGIHHLFNIVTGPKDAAHAVLIRAIEPIWGIEHIKKVRNQKRKNWTNGPGKLTQALGIKRSHDAQYLLKSESPIQLLKSQDPICRKAIMVSKRIGIDYAGEAKNWPWRFYNQQSPFVSVRLETDRSFFRQKSN